MLVLVVGGAGYIGSHASRTLKRNGYDVVIYDNLSTGYEFLAKGFPLVVGDIADTPKLADTLRRVDAVMHFAAHAYVGESVENPRKYFRNNIEGGLALLNTCLDCGVRKFIFSSTCAVYGVPVKVPIAEQNPLHPVNPYGATKLAFEYALQAYAPAYGLRFASLRYFNAAGADESREIGEMHDPETHLIPCALEAAAGTRPALEVFGTDYPTPDGTCVRDYIHVSDLADAHVAALRHLESGGDSLTLNLGTGTGYSVKEILSVVEEVTERKVPSHLGPRRPGDPPALVADPSAAQARLNWKAKCSVRDMVSTAWEWMQRRWQNDPQRSPSV
jgi:UDP-arabinose 4-epimerase